MPYASYTIFRATEEQAIGFTAFLAVREATLEDLEADPALQAAWNFVQRYGPARPGEEVIYQRFWMGCETYQVVGAISNMIHVTGGTYIFTNPKIAWTFITCADPDY